MNSQSRMYDVGGVLLARPFKARRLGHFALWQTDLDMARRLYVDVLGFRHTDTVERDGKPVAVFTSHGTDHHSLAAIHASTAEGVRKAHYENGVLVNQISFQVGTLEEVANAHEYFAQRQVTISRLGRDFPGSNWALYVLDPDGHRIEFYYGMEQIGWDRRSKPAAAYLREVRNGFTLPQPAEMTEIMNCERSGIDLGAGFRPDRGPALRLLRGRRDVAATVQGHEDRPDQAVRLRYRCLRALLHRASRPDQDRGGRLSRPPLRLSPLRRRASHHRPVSRWRCARSSASMPPAR